MEPILIRGGAKTTNRPSAEIWLSSNPGSVRADEELYDSGAVHTSASSQSPFLAVTIKNEHTQMGNVAGRLDRMANLKAGWNGYAAPAPTPEAIAFARGFISNLLNAQEGPVHVDPSAIGGVGVTRRSGNKLIYVEFYNDGKILALFSDEDDEEADPLIKQIVPGYQSYKDLSSEIRGFLNV
jgi:hypothetical protein